MKDNLTTISAAFLLLTGALLIGLIMAWPMMWLWNNCLVPAVTFANPVSFWQTWGLYILVQWFFTKSTSVKSNKK
jgi:hypothetical protein